jgi:hypothetical protein
MAATITDIYEIQFRGDSRQLKTALADVKSQLAAVRKDLQGAGNIFAPLGMAAGKLGMVATALGGLVGIGGLGALAAQALKASWQFETLNLQLAVTLGSLERARQVGRFVQQLAGPSAFFDTQQLGEAAVLLSTYNLEIERFLPLASTMASLIGQDQEALMQFAGALGRLKSGQFGESMEIFRRFGLGRQVLEQYGARFGGNGSPIGDPEELLGAVERAVKGRFGSLDRIMGGSSMARYTSMLDAFQRLLVKVGDAMNKAVLPAMEAMGEALDALASSPAFGGLSQFFASFANPEKIRGTVFLMVAWADYMIARIPEIAKSVSGVLSEAFARVREVAAATLAIVAGMASAKVVGAVFELVRAFVALRRAMQGVGAVAALIQTIGGVKGIAMALAGIGAGAAAYYGMEAVFGGGGEATKPGAATGALGGVEDEIQARVRRLMAVAEERKAAPAPETAQPPAQPWTQPILSEQTQVLRAVERNTRRQVELQQALLGGGELARALAGPSGLWRVRRGAYGASWLPVGG